MATFLPNDSLHCLMLHATNSLQYDRSVDVFEYRLHRYDNIGNQFSIFLIILLTVLNGAWINSGEMKCCVKF